MLLIVLFQVMVFSFAACGTDEPAKDPTNPDAPVEGDEAAEENAKQKDEEVRLFQQRAQRISFV